MGYAARAGSADRYYDTLAKWRGTSATATTTAIPWRRRAPNAFGLYDMLGNVYEWVLDRYYNKYDDTSEEIEEPLASNATAVARGGAWHAEAKDVRVSNRSAPPDYADANVGFRCALS